uniref:Septin 12 n=2 Tax=Paramormyrops kingsleyae TaxID=1676925 RepID=A0A3B3Q5Y6_9TELE|nr:septin-9-like isoform X1 [Paramormyrops kingsleyae]
MSDLSVNDHLEGILSDFEALKRSFDIEDVDEIPAYSPSSNLSSPFSPSPVLSKANDGRGPANHGPPSYQSRISVGSSPAQSPVMKSKMVTSLSFNRGTIGVVRANGNTGSGITRVSSFQSRFNPNGFLSSGPGSDNDSLHSSSSSLDYQGTSKVSSLASPPQSPIGVSEYKPQHLANPALKKFSSHGNVFHSEVEAPTLLATEPVGVNHGSMPSLDLQISDSSGRRNAGPLGVRYAGMAPTWGSNPLGRVPSFSSSPQPPKPKEPARLSKFPLDLDSLVAKPQVPLLEAIPAPKPAPKHNGNLISPSNTPIIPTHTLDAVPPSPGSLPVPSISESPVPLSPAQTPQLKLVSQPQVVQLSPDPAALTPGPGPDVLQDAGETVGSILQRIASFTPASAVGLRPRESNRSNGVQEQETAVHLQQFQQDDTTQGPEPQVHMAERKAELEQQPCVAEPRPQGHVMAMEPRTQGRISGSELIGYVGIEAVLDQMKRKAMKTGFEFNIMVVGQSGLGKSTLVNTLFKSKVSRKSCTPDHEEKIPKTVQLQSVSHEIEEKGVKMKLTVIDTPGFGDQINNENCWDPIVTYINEQYEKYLVEELNVNRKRRIPDTRVHCCVYFLPATGHCLRQIDVEFMQRLGTVVSIVPVIAKADTLTLEERLDFKARIRQNMQDHGIRVYPQREYDEDEDDALRNDKIRENIPFAVVGTDKEHQVNGNKVLGRKTKWGIIEVENVAHCEFANLRDLLIRSHLQDLKDVTQNHYEEYRVRRLNESNARGLELSPVNGYVAKSDAESHL